MNMPLIRALRWQCENCQQSSHNFEVDNIHEILDGYERLAGVASALLSRKKQGPSEDPHIFAEWDDLEDVLALVRPSRDEGS